MKKQIAPTKLIINNFDSIMPFGKYKGYKIRYIVDNEPSYILWLSDNDIVKFSDEIWDEADENDGRKISEYEYEEPYWLWSDD